MKFISQFEAVMLGTAELYGLRKRAFIAFSAAARGSQKQRDALTSMRNIERELARRNPTP